MIDKVLEERGDRYGEYKDVSRVSQELKLVIQKAWKKNKAYHTMATYPHTESLDMICNKIARAVCGDPMYTDNWVDIIGYSQLVLNEIEDKDIQAHEVYPMAEPSLDEAVRHYEATKNKEEYQHSTVQSGAL